MNKKIIISLVGIFSVIATSAVLASYTIIKDAGSHEKAIPDAGEKAPGFEAEDMAGQKISFDERTGKALLLMFLDLQAPFSSDESVDSRGQVTFAKSMYKQYESVGLKVVMIDSGYMRTGRETDKDRLINFTYDQRLEGIPLIADKKTLGLAKKYAVKQLPTSFLIDEDGIVNQRWDGCVLTSQLALSIENIVGPPEYRREAMTNGDKGQKSLGQDSLPPEPGDTAALAKFPGLLPARPLSENIWLVDGGKPWKRGTEYPIRWLVLNGSEESAIEVKARNRENGESVTLLEKTAMEPVPGDEEKVLLTNLEGLSTHVYLLDTTVSIDISGKYIITASICEGMDKTEPKYTGEALVTVE